MLRKILALLIIFCIAGFAATGLAGLWIVKCENYLDRNRITLELDIPKNSNFTYLYDRVFKKLNTPPCFREYLILVKKADKKLKYGYYKAEDITLREYLDNIFKGAQSTLKVTIPEGFNTHDIAALLEKQKITDNASFLAACNDDAFVKSLTGYEASTVEGFLYPDTYYFPPYTDPKYVIRTMHMNFLKNLPENFAEKVQAQGLTPYKAVTLASIVQKETYNIEESRIVASVFYNRLRKRMRLQADPTIIYGKYAEFDGNIRKTDIQDGTNPYNTYVIYGLPPSPISNPSAQALEAVAEPEKTDFLYFVAGKDGRHIFSKSYAEHRRNVYLTQKKH
jgi:UPF0755 protein